jgi:pimeloyl-ACP methyl ester carboxylesterase
MQLMVNGVLSFGETVFPDAKTTVVVLPGWGQNSGHWKSFVQRLPSSYRYFLLDLPGFGQTQFLPSGAGVDEYVEWLHELLSKADIKKPILFGHSFGGQVATAYAAKYPHDLQKLILLSPGSIRNKTRKVRILEKVYRHLRWIKRMTPAFLFSWLRPYLASDDYYAASPEQKAVLSKIILKDQQSRLKNIQVPTAVIWGDRDTEIPYSGKILAEKIPHARLFVLYGADHSPQLTSPEKLAKVVREIL